MTSILIDFYQCRALLLKSVTLQLRQWKSNIFQLLMPIAVLLFVFILYIVVNWLYYTTASPYAKAGVQVLPPKSPLAVNAGMVSLLTLKAAGNITFTPAQEFLFSYDESKVNRSMLGILNGDGTATPYAYSSFLGVGSYFYLPYRENGTTKVKLPYFERMSSEQDIDSFLFQELGKSGAENISFAGTLNFRDLSLSAGNVRLGYDLHFDNQSRTMYCATLKGHLPDCAVGTSSYMMNYLHNLLAMKLSNNTFTLSTSTVTMPYAKKINYFNAHDTMGPLFFPFVLFLMLPVFVYSLTLEKSGRLRVLMEISGLKRRNYYFVTYAFFYFLYWICAAEFCIVSAILGFYFMLKTNALVYILMLAAWGFALVSLAFVMSVFIHSTIVAYIVAFLVALFGPMVSSVIEGAIMWRDVWPFKFLLLLSPLTLTEIMTEQVVACAKLRCLGIDSLIYNMQVYAPIAAMFLDGILYFIIYLYLDAVVPYPWGVQRHPLFFLEWTWEWIRKKRRQKHVQDMLAKLETETAQMDEDVANERKAVLDGTWTKENTGILIDHLFKRYNRHKIAVNGVCLGFGKTGCIGLLGSNGAGKTTTISMLAGLFPATGGNAYVNGYDIRTQMDKIHLSLGLCPQFDILYPDLTCLEHLLFFSRIKGISITEERKHAEEMLEKVGLSKKTLKRSPLAGALSGGMKRRLSLAISLCGKPKIVLLDEPSTGIDPKTRRHLWKIILEAKKDRCILLTTHSMIEADVLSDKIAIFSKGKLRAVGSSMHLRHKFGEGLKLHVNFEPHDKQRACEIIEKMLPTATRTSEYHTTASYDIPREGIKISQLFERLENEKNERGIIKEHALSQATLEDVFLVLVRREIEEEIRAQALAEADMSAEYKPKDETPEAENGAENELQEEVDKTSSGSARYRQEVLTEV